MAAIEVSVDLGGGVEGNPARKEKQKTESIGLEFVRAWGGLGKKYRLAPADSAINQSHAHALALAGKIVELELIDEGIGFSPKSHQAQLPSRRVTPCRHCTSKGSQLTYQSLQFLGWTAQTGEIGFSGEFVDSTILV